MLTWHMAGYESTETRMMTIQAVCQMLDKKQDLFILDVRSEKEVIHTSEIPGAYHLPVTQLPQRKKEIPRDKMSYIFCGSGLRSMMAASYLQREGWNKTTVILGGLSGWNSSSCPLK